MIVGCSAARGAESFVSQDIDCSVGGSAERFVAVGIKCFGVHSWLAWGITETWGSSSVLILGVGVAAGLFWSQTGFQMLT